MRSAKSADRPPYRPIRPFYMGNIEKMKKHENLSDILEVHMVAGSGRRVIIRPEMSSTHPKDPSMYLSWFVILYFSLNVPTNVMQKTKNLTAS